VARQILLVDDDALLRRSLAYNLEQNGFKASTASSAEDALEVIRLNRPDLVILDIGLPGMDGLEAVRIIRDTYHLPVIFLTARHRELDEVLGLELGADDYLTKPFNLDILIARIKSVLRRSSQASPTEPQANEIHIGNLTIAPSAHSVFLNDHAIELSPREFDLLYTLAVNAGRVVTVDDLLSRVWGAEFAGEPQVVYVHIRWLREKIEENPNHPKKLITIRGVGYKLVP